MEVHEFEAEMLTDEKYKNSAYVEIPFNVEEVFGTRGQVKVKAEFDGVPYRGSIANMGMGCHILILRKDIRAKVGKDIGDRVHVRLQKDTEPRIVEVPEILQKALDENPDAKAFYDSLAYTYRKEYAVWIRSAKREETRQRRLQKAIDKLKNKVKAP